MKKLSLLTFGAIAAVTLSGCGASTSYADYLDAAPSKSVAISYDEYNPGWSAVLTYMPSRNTYAFGVTFKSGKLSITTVHSFSLDKYKEGTHRTNITDASGGTFIVGATDIKYGSSGTIKTYSSQIESSGYSSLSATEAFTYTKVAIEQYNIGLIAMKKELASLHVSWIA